MELRNGVTSVQIQAEQPAVRDLLSHQLGSLRDALQTHGLTVDKLEVRTAPPTGTGMERQADGSAYDGRSRGEFFTRQQPGQSSAVVAEDENFAEAMVNAVA